MVENPGYDIILPHEINSKPSPAKTMQSKIETMKGETLTSADLLNFAIQIAHGMVSSAFNELEFIFNPFLNVFTGILGQQITIAS